MTTFGLALLPRQVWLLNPPHLGSNGTASPASVYARSPVMSHIRSTVRPHGAGPLPPWRGSGMSAFRVSAGS
ncbi:hypothetical protein BDV59DRAFT_189269 [Aspergillus ambiguus]|uniref:uncharacterized protein n=1 Tax=Aspergillus ambiguus TaxID=176160 RepID=UPI003CCD3D2D